MGGGQIRGYLTFPKYALLPKTLFLFVQGEKWRAPNDTLPPLESVCVCVWGGYEPCAPPLSYTPELYMDLAVVHIATLTVARCLGSDLDDAVFLFAFKDSKTITSQEVGPVVRSCGFNPSQEDLKDICQVVKQKCRDLLSGNRGVGQVSALRVSFNVC